MQRHSHPVGTSRRPASLVPNRFAGVMALMLQQGCPLPQSGGGPPLGPMPGSTLVQEQGCPGQLCRVARFVLQALKGKLEFPKARGRGSLDLDGTGCTAVERRMRRRRASPASLLPLTGILSTTSSNFYPASTSPVSCSPHSAAKPATGSSSRHGAGAPHSAPRAAQRTRAGRPHPRRRRRRRHRGSCAAAGLTRQCCPQP